MSPLPPNFTIRPATMDDIAAVVAASNAYYATMPGDIRISEGWIRGLWEMPGTNLVKDSRVILNERGQIVAYLLLRYDDHIIIGREGIVHPDFQRRGLGRHLFEAAEVRANETIADAPPEVRIAARHWVNHGDANAAQLLTSMGYQYNRAFLRMIIQLEVPPPAPEIPAGITIRPVDPTEDLRPIYDASVEAFQDHWSPNHLEFDQWVHYRTKRGNFDPSLWFIARAGDEIAGTTLGFPNRDNDPGFGWVSEVTVRRPYRKQGIALALLNSAFGEFYRRGFAKVGLHVDGENPTGAKRLYERAGMNAVSQSDSYEKEIRAGAEMG